MANLYTVWEKMKKIIDFVIRPMYSNVGQKRYSLFPFVQRRGISLWKSMQSCYIRAIYLILASMEMVIFMIML